VTAADSRIEHYGFLGAGAVDSRVGRWSCGGGPGTPSWAAGGLGSEAAGKPASHCGAHGPARGSKREPVRDGGATNNRIGEIGRATHPRSGQPRPGRSHDWDGSSQRTSSYVSEPVETTPLAGKLQIQRAYCIPRSEDENPP
jgi:hypothetical protein